MIIFGSELHGESRWANCRGIWYIFLCDDEQARLKVFPEVGYLSLCDSKRVFDII